MQENDNSVRTCVVGTRWRGAKAIEAIARMKRGDAVRLEREHGNRHDYAAIACHFHGLHVGYIPRQVNGQIARSMDTGSIATAVVTEPAQVNHGYIAKEPMLCVTIGAEPQL